ncbi:MAG: glycosyltransferase [Candidatus Hodarchaeota archaeon]
MKKPIYDLSIILPCYNEEKNIVKSIRKLVQYLNGQSWKSEIIIGNDGSKDQTVSKSLKTFSKNKWASYLIVEHFPNRGRGAILKKAFQKARGKYVMYMDADLATELNHINDLMKILNEGFYIVTGSRLLPNSNISRPILREILSRCYNRLVRLFFWDGIKDHQCGFKGINYKLIPQITSAVDSTGWFWDTETLVLCQKLYGIEIKEIPIHWREYRGKKESKVKIINTIQSYITKIFWLKMKIWRFNYQKHRSQ